MEEVRKKFGRNTGEARRNTGRSTEEVLIKFGRSQNEARKNHGRSVKDARK